MGMLVNAQNSDDEERKKFAENTKGIVFYSTPHKGSEIANLNMITKYFFSPSVEVQELNTDYPLLLELNNYFKAFVNPESSNPGVGDYYTVPFNHMDICKPSSRKSILFRKFYNLLWDTVDEATPHT